MTFLNPLYLIALAAAAIPVILHLLNLRRTRVLEFSTLSFLKELQRSKIRRLKIRQILLLILRTLIIIFIVFAFSRPAFRGSFGGLLGAKAKSSVVIVFDDSFSMLASDDGGQLLKQAKARAGQILDLLQPGDEVALIRVSNLHGEQVSFTAATHVVRAEIDRLQASYAHSILTDALTAANLLLATSSNLNKEVYVITDEQRSHYFISGSTGGPPVKLFHGGINVFLFPVGTRPVHNAAAISAVVRNSLFEKGKPVTVSGTIFNSGIRSLRGDIVSLYIDGERVMQKSVDVEPGSRKEVEFTVVPKTDGFIEGFLQLEDDELPEDNRRYFSFHVPERIRLLIVADQPEDAAFLRLALAAFESGEPDKGLSITSMDGVRAQSENFKKYEVLFFVAGANAGDVLRDRLVSFVSDGGAAFVFPGGNPENIRAFSSIATGLRLPPVTSTSGAFGSTQSLARFDKIDFDHPLFRGVFQQTDDKKLPQVESPRIFLSATLQGTENSHVVVSLGGGRPFLLEQSAGQGRALFCAVSPVLSWSDFPLKGVFVPLLHRSAYYLSSHDYSSLAHSVGESFEVTLPLTFDAAATFTLKSPSGKETRIVPKTLVSGLHFAIGNLSEPGNYRLISGGSTARVVPLNVDPAESDMTRISSAEREAFWKSLGVDRPTIFSHSSDVQRTILQARFGLELWKFCLAFALICAIAEMMIARDGRKRRPEREG